MPKHRVGVPVRGPPPPGGGTAGTAAKTAAAERAQTATVAATILCRAGSAVLKSWFRSRGTIHCFFSRPPELVFNFEQFSVKLLFFFFKFKIIFIF